jgi:hypothetical protein
MHRMRCYIARASLTLALATLLGSSSRAALIRPDAVYAFPDVAAGFNGTVTYNYDGSSQKGQFVMANTPYLLSLAGTPLSEFNVTPTGSGIRQQTLSLTLNSQGNLDPTANNSYSLYGKVVVGQNTYSGLLLQGTATAFGFQNLTASGVQGQNIFDVNLNITGGALASLFGSSAYLRLQSDASSTFAGGFGQSFSAYDVQSSTYGNPNVNPAPVPEPSTLVVILACGGAGLLYRTRRRIAATDLESAS